MIPLTITGIPQFQFQTRDLSKAQRFYQQLLGLSPLAREERSLSLGMASGRIDLYEAPFDSALHGENTSAVGSQRFCFRASGDPAAAMVDLREMGAEVLEGSLCSGEGALGPMKSFCLFDPDQNLVELAFYETRNRPLQLLTIDSVSLLSADCGRSLAFYETLGVRSSHAEEGLCVLPVGRQRLLLCQDSRRCPAHAPYAAAGSATFTLTAAGSSARVRSELEALGLSFREDRSAFCLFDADGNLLRLLPEGGA